MVAIRVKGSPNVLEADAGTSLLSCLLRNNVPISTSCGGRATCGLCRVSILAGKQHLAPINAAEVGHLGNVAKVIGTRLACQCVVQPDAAGEVEVDVPTPDDVAERKARKAKLMGRTRNERDSHARAASAADRSRQSGEPEERIEWRPRKQKPPVEPSGS